MAKYEDYVKKVVPSVDGIDSEIADASSQQVARQDRDPITGQFVSTQQQTDWESRYKELEKHNSRQAQTVGEYRKIIDEFIVNPTPTKPVAAKEPPVKITLDAIYADPDKTINSAVESHPAIQEAKQFNQKNKEAELQKAINSFSERHPDYQEIVTTPEFQNWVRLNPTRADLYARGNQYDLSAADALFSLYKAESGLAKTNQTNRQQRQIAIAELESSSNFVASTPPKYSRHEYIDMLTKAKQGVRSAEDWINRNSEGYRQALARGNVRD